MELERRDHDAMSKFLTRRNLLSVAPLSVSGGGKPPLPGGGKLLAASTGLAWRPATKLGMAIENGEGSPGQRALSAGQKQYLWPLGVSFIRMIYRCYQWNPIGSGYPPNFFDAAQRLIQSVQVYAEDSTQLQINCTGGTYAVPAGDTVVLSVPLSYRPRLGNTVVLPARTPIRCTGGTAGTFSGKTQTVPSTIRVPAGGSVAGNGVQTVSGANILHQNFYTSGTNVRWEIRNIVNSVNQWLAQGFAFDLGGYMSNWGTLYGLFGLENVLPIREQEWAFFASQGWDPAQVMISDENEFFFAEYDYKSHIGAWQEYAAYFQGTLYPRLRSHFPKHTLGLGGPWGGDMNGAPYLQWWPNDSNTLLRMHCYLGPGSAGVTTGTVADIQHYFTQLNYTIQRIGVPNVYLQEFGFSPALINRTAPSIVTTWVSNVRLAALQRGWFACGYSMSARDNPPGTPGFFGYPNANGVWMPELSSGGFGLAAPSASP